MAININLQRISSLRSVGLGPTLIVRSMLGMQDATRSIREVTRKLWPAAEVLKAVSTLGLTIHRMCHELTSQVLILGSGFGFCSAWLTTPLMLLSDMHAETRTVGERKPTNFTSQNFSNGSDLFQGGRLFFLISPGANAQSRLINPGCCRGKAWLTE